MTKVKLKLPVLFLFVVALVILPVLTMKFVSTEPSEEVTDYTMDEVIESELPVINQTTTIINPYTDPSVSIKKGYFF